MTTATDEATPERLPERFYAWVLSGKGTIHGQFSVHATDEPDEFVEIHRDASGTISLITEQIAGNPMQIERRPEFDDDGPLLVSRFRNPVDGLNGENRYEYEDGLLCARQEVLEDGTVNFKTLTKTSPDGLFLEETSLSGDDEFKERHQYEYNELGQVICDRHMVDRDSDEERGHHIFEYDSTGKVTRCAWHTADGAEQSAIVYGYDDRGRRKSMATWRDGHEVFRAVTNYDERGRRLSTDYFSGDDDNPVMLERTATGDSDWRRSTHLPALSGENCNRLTPTPDQLCAQRQLAFFHYENGRFVEAITVFKCLVAHDPNDVYSLSGVAAAALRLGQKETAANWFSRALAVDPDHQPSRKAMASLYPSNG